jgi:Na+/proline symporter
VIQISIIRERNVRRGIIISSLVTVGSYIIVSFISIIVGFIFTGFYLFADIQFALGTIFGVIITLNNRQQHQGMLISGVITGVIGGIISSVLIGLYQMILIAFFYGPSITIFLLYLGLSLISGIVIGLIGGAIIATYYTYREIKRESEEETLDDDFFDDLIKK